MDGRPAQSRGRMKLFYVYLLRCADGSYYCGHTDDIGLRMQQHADSETGYTATRKPVTLAWQGEFEKREDALAFEQQIKKWSRAKKEALIAGDWGKISELAKSKIVVPQILSHLKSALRQAQGELSCEDAIESVGQIPLPVRPELVEGHCWSESCGSTSSPRTGNFQHFQTHPGSEQEPNLSANDQTLVNDVLSGQRRALAKAITLIESVRTDHQLRAEQVLNALLPHTGNVIRLGISGAPGAGKSTFIEALGLWLIERGHRIAVLAIDPSSSISGGSILGDKTRMEQLCQREEAFIRPSPSAGSLGGGAEKTREAMLLCEAAGYDVIIVETVGVGQSETTVAGMVDIFCLLQLPNAGDDLQAIKKGIVEIADMVVINKADINPQAAAVARNQWRNALHMLRPASPNWAPPVIALSALHKEGIADFWEHIEKYRAALTPTGELAARRRHQALAWMWQIVESGLHVRFREHPAVQAALPELLGAVEDGRITPAVAAAKLLKHMQD